MDFRKMRLVISAPDKRSWPESALPEIVLAGRSNVGKSSLINTLAKNHRMAYVGKTPGKTRLLNFFEVDQQLMLVDVPGYGYARASDQMLLQFGQMMEDYFSERQNIKGVLLLVDARHRPTEDDLSMIEFARYYEFPIVLAATKIDKCSRSERARRLAEIAQITEVDPAQLIPFSSETEEGRAELITALEALIKN